MIETPSTRPPNVVIIFADDWGFGDLSCLNPESRIPTPCTDALARQGTVFLDAHSCSAVCTPSRYGLLTGRYAWRGRLKEGVLFGYSRELIEPGRATIASLLRGAGYRTACIGKWHLGLGWRRTDGSRVPVEENGKEDPGVDFSAPLDAGPHTVGFDYSFILPASLDMAPYLYIENGRVVEAPAGSCAASPRPAFWRAGACAPGFRHEECLPEITRRAEAWIARRAADPSQPPFFLYLALPSPHTPHVPTAEFRGASRCGAYGDYGVEHDACIGRIAAALERGGFSDRTLLIVTSDNGAHLRGEGFDFEREYGHRANHIYRGQKSDAWDGGHRIPFIAVWPGHLPAGGVCRQLVCQTDLPATAAELAGVALPDDAAEDSFSLVPLLEGRLETRVRETFIGSSVTNRHAFRTGRWKLIEGPGSGGWSAPDKKAPPEAPPAQLYDLEADPEERVNLYAREPRRVAEMRAGLEEIRRAGRSRPP